LLKPNPILPIFTRALSWCFYVKWYRCRCVSRLNGIRPFNHPADAYSRRSLYTTGNLIRPIAWPQLDNNHISRLSKQISGSCGQQAKIDLSVSRHLSSAKSITCSE
jgi:hypothetical protein